MVLRLYASSQPLLLISLPVLAALGLLPLLGSLPKAPATLGYPAEAWFADIYQGPLTMLIIAWVLISLVAWRINSMFNRREFYPSAVYMPGLVYTLLGCLCCLEEVSLPVLSANLFVVAGINQVLAVYRQHRAFSEYFKAGLYLGIAALLYPPFLVLGVGLWAAIAFTRSFQWREYILAALAFATPFVWWLTMLFLTDSLESAVLMHWKRDVTHFEMGSNALLLGRVGYFFSAAAFILGVPRFLFSRDRATNRARNLSGVFLVFTLFFLGALVVSVWTMGAWNFSALLVPFTILSSAWYANYRYSLLAPFVFYGWLGTLFALMLDVAGVF